MRIGFFDSGLGGLTVLKTVRELLPMYDYLYYGDTANLPYGDKSKEDILAFSRKAIEYLFEHDCTVVIVACNTASSEALRILQDTMLVGQYSERRLLGVVIPTVEALVEHHVQNALLIGTLRTISSQKYETEIEKLSTKIALDSQATPHLVPYIETGDISGAEEKVKSVIVSKMGEIDTVILGCTHYTVLKDFIRKEFPGLRVISQDEIIPKKFLDYLERHVELRRQLSQNRTLEIVLTREDERYEQIKRDLLAV